MSFEIHNKFAPDLIVEVTNQCNKFCTGCYAPNIFTKDPYSSNSRVKNMSLKVLEQAWIEHSVLKSAKLIAVRGGEPTLNPEIVNILNFLVKNATEVYLETHGEWIDTNIDLLSNFARLKVIVKLSIDKMHKSDLLKTKDRVNKLTQYNIPFVVAVTETSKDEFENFVSKNLMGIDCHFIFQKKMDNIENLIKPSIGVLTATGKINKTVSVRESFKKKPIEVLA